jgi:hypothetical protein
MKWRRFLLMRPSHRGAQLVERTTTRVQIQKPYWTPEITSESSEIHYFDLTIVNAPFIQAQKDWWCGDEAEEQQQ